MIAALRSPQLTTHNLHPATGGRAMASEDGSGGQAAVIGRMAEAAAALLTLLRPDQLAAVALPFEDAQRRRWFYTPTVQAGLQLADMDPAQQPAPHRVLATGVSFPGYITAATIMGLDNVLDAEEGWRGGYLGRPEPSR